MLGSGSLGMLGKIRYASGALKASRVAETGDLVVDGSDAAKAAQAAGHTLVPLTKSEKTGLVIKTIDPLHKVPHEERIVQKPILKAPVPGALGDTLPETTPPVALGKIAEGPAQVTQAPVQIGTASQAPLARLAQAGHDALVQKGLDSGKGVLGAYAKKRVAGSIDESARVTQNVRSTIERQIVLASKHLDVPKKVGQLAMFLRSAGVSAEEAAKFWSENGQPKWAALASKLHANQVLKIGPDGRVAINADKYPKLAHADSMVSHGQALREGILTEHNLMTPEGLQTRLNLVAEIMKSEAARSDETGVRTGQGFISLKRRRPSFPRAPWSPRQAATSFPAQRRFQSAPKEATGSGIAKGLIPASTTKAVARAVHDALRFVNSAELRAAVARLGSDVKSKGDEVLIRDPAQQGAVEVPTHIQELLGHGESTLTQPQEATLRAALAHVVSQAIPGMQENYAADRAAEIGTRAPAGYKWVPRQMLPDSLTSAIEPRSTAGKFVDAVNSAITSATVYFKLGHLPTRLLTNLSTNIVQGSLAPFELAKSAKLANELTELQKLELKAATGTHGYESLPHAGAGPIAKVAASGARAWARKVDAPFRLNAILYEFRQIGITTPEEVERALIHLRDPARAGMSASAIARLDGAVRRANRASIMYDGISAAEKRSVNRLIWFYPWTKGAVRFAGHTLAEHPVKSTVLAQIGQRGDNARDRALGQVPSYELGLTPITGGANPLTSNVSSFTPYSTTGSVAQLAEHPLNQDTGFFSQLNPFFSALTKLASGSGVEAAGSQALQPTPEFQAVTAYRHPPGPNKMFGSTDFGIDESDPKVKGLISALARALGGAGVPRPTNLTELNKVAQEQHEKKRTITIYG